MKQAFIFHGVGGSRDENWFEWLSYRLEEDGYEVIIPQFPTPVGQSLSSWNEVFEDYIEDLNEESLLIGHSIGANFVLRILEQLTAANHNSVIAGAYLAAPVIDTMGIAEFDEPNTSFIAEPFNWANITAATQTIHVLHGSDDPYVPVTQAEHVAESANAQLHIIERGGHLNKAAGYTHFPELLEIIQAS